MKSFPATLGILAWLSATAHGALVEGIPIGTNSALVFARVEAGVKVVTNRDAFIAALSPFERSGRMVTNREVSEDEFLEFAGRNVLPWTPGDTNHLTRALQTAAAKLAPWNLPFPTEILLIKTTGREEINADYTRQNAILMPQSEVGSASYRVFLHELFHVLSRQNPALREKLYGVIGFHRINEVQAPEELWRRRWTNPDGIQNGWRISVTNQDREIQAVPGLFASEDFDYTAPVNPFGFFRLLVVKQDGGQWVPDLADGHAQLLQVHEITGFYEQVGRNTRYLIHPDEILADNFVRLMNGDTNAQTPRVLDEMAKILRTPVPSNAH